MQLRRDLSTRAPAPPPAARWARRSRRGAPVLVALLLATVSPSAARAVTPSSAVDCLQRSRVVQSERSDYFEKYRQADPADDTTFDLRRSRFHYYIDNQQPPKTNDRPVVLGLGSRPSRMCVVGGVIAGDQSRSLGWEELKHCDSGAPWDYPCSQDGPALALDGVDSYVADGVRIDNTMDALGGGTTSDRAHYRNIYARYIRDDCIGNDRLRSVTVSDSLFDGCYVGISQDPLGSPALDRTESVTLDHVLLRLARMPGGYRADTRERNHGKFFKWSPSANRLVITNSILLAEHSRFGDALDFPAGAVASNVTIVWLGGGAYPGRLVPGVRVTTDRGVWDRAKADWLARHGCASFDSCTGKLFKPDPAG